MEKKVQLIILFLLFSLLFWVYPKNILATSNVVGTKTKVLTEISEKEAGNDTYVMYGPIEQGIYIPHRMVLILRFVFNVIRYAVPIILIILGMVDFSRAVISNDSDMIPKALKRFGERIMAAALVFCALAIVKILFTVVGGSENLFGFVNCVLNNDHCVHASLDEQVINPNIKMPKIRTDLKYIVKKVLKSNNTTGNNTATDNNNTSSGMIFIGDSRFVGMQKVVSSNKDAYIAEVGKGYDWFVSTAIPKINTLIKASNKKYTIFINLGINDAIYNGVNSVQVQKYADKINELANGSWKKHKVVFVSVNPKFGLGGAYPHITNGAIQSFNTSIKGMLNKNVSYCDTYNGIGETGFQAETTGEIHYTPETYKKIYNYIVKNCK